MQFPAALFALLGMVLTAGTVWAGGSGLNVIVVVNQNSTNSIQLGNDYCERRGVPPQNVLRMTGWSGSAISWNRTDFESRLLNPLLGMIASRGLTNQADVVLLSMDIPYRVVDGGSQNSTTSALFYGFKPDTAPPEAGLPWSCSLPTASSNSYAFCELPLRLSPPNTASTNSFLAMMLTDNSLAQAEQILQSGVVSDSSFPTQAVYLAKTTDVARNVRYWEFDEAIFSSLVFGDSSLVWVNTDAASFTNLRGLLTGLATLSLPTNALVPGAMGDSLTSYAGDLFENTGQTSLLAFLNAGAAGSYGTVVEPCNYTEKFPHPLDYFYQRRGFSLAEAYYQSLRNPYQGLLVGEPLAAPFARRGTPTWNSLTNGQVLSGLATLDLSFLSAATNLPAGQVDLFIDGTFFQTLTNLPPGSGNVLSVVLNGVSVTYTVPANATVASAATALAAALNAQTNSTRVQVHAIGDRLELQSLALATPGNLVTLSANSAPGTLGQLTTWLTPARPAFLDTVATGYLNEVVGNAPVVGDWLQLSIIKTNGSQTTIAVTNTTAGTSINTLLQSLMNLVNSHPALQGADGVSASDLYGDGSLVQFALHARSPGWPAAQIQATLSGSTNLQVQTTGTQRLEDNLSDLRPRNHLYVSSGLGSLAVHGQLDTTRLADGFHELAAVACEGTSIRTQTRVTRTVQIQNSSLSATLALSVVGTNVTLDAPLQATVTANTAAMDRIELFSTGGSLGVISNQQAATFQVPSSALGLGLHPLYAVASDSSGHQYRTGTKWLRLIPSFQLSLIGSPLVLSWPAIPGQRYDILSTPNITNTFQVTASVTASNSLVQWPVTAPGAEAAFYRVRLSP